MRHSDLDDIYTYASDSEVSQYTSWAPHTSPDETRQFVRRVLDGQSADDAETLAVFADAFTQPDFIEGVGAFLEKRKPVFK